MRRPLIVAVFVAAMVVVASSVTAQTTALDMPVPAGVMEGIVNPTGFVMRPVEADGNPSTSEWLIRHVPPPGSEWTYPIWADWYRVVAIGSTGTCNGPWFSPASTTYTEGQADIHFINGHDEMHVTYRNTAPPSAERIRVVNFVRPPCP
jgi:hypothetical protein